MVALKNDYEKIVKVAEKFTAKTETRPTLTGIFHHADGRVVATDGHRLIIVENGHTGELAGQIIRGNTVIVGNYPQFDRIIPQNPKDVIKRLDIDEWLKGHKELMDVAKKKTIVQTKYKRFPSYGSVVSKLIAKYDGQAWLQVSRVNVVTKEKKEEKEKPVIVDDERTLMDITGAEFVIHYNLQYMIDALVSLKKLGYEECELQYNGNMSPMVLKTKSVMIIIMPVRIDN